MDSPCIWVQSQGDAQREHGRHGQVLQKGPMSVSVVMINQLRILVVKQKLFYNSKYPSVSLVYDLPDIFFLIATKDRVLILFLKIFLYQSVANL